VRTTATDASGSVSAAASGRSAQQATAAVETDAGAARIEMTDGRNLRKTRKSGTLVPPPTQAAAAAAATTAAPAPARSPTPTTARPTTARTDANCQLKRSERKRKGRPGES
jgi:hypothetical protein